jgi:DNA repair ATPase RecN
MGLVSGLIRQQAMQDMALDLEYKIQTLSATKMQLASQGLDLVTIGTDMDIDSPELKHLEARREKLQLMEKKIDAEMTKCQTMLKMAEKEMENAQKMVDNGINRIFGQPASR